MSRQGQSLIEVLVATAVGTVLLVGALTVIVPALKGNSQAQYAQTAGGLARELLDNVQVWTGNNWNNLASLTHGSSTHYYLSATSSPFTVVAGNESVSVGTSTYARYFYVENVGRTSESIQTTGGTNDPSTQKVTVVYAWPQAATRTISTYVTRARTRILWQTDWSGGGGQDGPTTTINSLYSTSTNMSVTSSTGSLRINGI